MSALAQFVATIEVTGGVREYRDGSVGCAADPAWADLADAYLAACTELGRNPKVIQSAFATWEDDV